MVGSVSDCGGEYDESEEVCGGFESYDSVWSLEEKNGCGEDLRDEHVDR